MTFGCGNAVVVVVVVADGLLLVRPIARSLLCSRFSAAALNDHGSLVALLESIQTSDHLRKVDPRALMAALSPLTDAQYMFALDESDTLAKHHLATTTLFPVCQSVLAESMSVGAHSFQTVASDSRVDVHDRAAALLFDGRTPRPLAGSLPLFGELTLLHWYSPRMTTSTTQQSQQSNHRCDDDDE